ncbi:unnamed protein product [Bursaphelenchus xylophilus]|uniref:(pine wood nematode) hypothetical protein n=1 Tax=Bursaphelenchus xylophilus TaxID=6326 RepID=A0A1I7RU71_BURXY|nr:unnamed protein product [Bursaphelenchus xylophilus]CAG9113880.1 unnamed protein product [Bursaphelenchus xylophilus]
MYVRAHGMFTGADGEEAEQMVIDFEATEMTKYTCTAVIAYRVPFGDSWYCMSLSVYTPNSYTLWSDNYCGDVLTDGYGIKFVHPLVYGFTYAFSQV